MRMLLVPNIQFSVLEWIDHSQSAGAPLIRQGLFEKVKQYQMKVGLFLTFLTEFNNFIE
jgi:hypothetical protein